MKIGESSRCFEAVNNCQRMDLKLEKNALPSADLGHFEYRAPQAHMAGVVIGAPRGLTDSKAGLLTKQISERMGAGLIVAYGFKSKRISVAQPISRTQSQPAPAEPAKRRSVFHEFKDIFRKICNGDVRLYVELRLRKGNDEIQGIEVASWL